MQCPQDHSHCNEIWEDLVPNGHAQSLVLSTHVRLSDSPGPSELLTVNLTVHSTQQKEADHQGREVRQESVRRCLHQEDVDGQNWVERAGCSVGKERVCRCAGQCLGNLQCEQFPFLASRIPQQVTERFCMSSAAWYAGK